MTLLPKKKGILALLLKSKLLARLCTPSVRMCPVVEAHTGFDSASDTLMHFTFRDKSNYLHAKL